MKRFIQAGLLLAACTGWLAQCIDLRTTASERRGRVGRRERAPRDEPAGVDDRPAERVAFVYTGGVFLRKGKLRWVEHRFEGPPSTFLETARTPEFVELYDRDRDLLVRLRDDHGEWLVREDAAWVPWPGSEGGWR